MGRIRPEVIGLKPIRSLSGSLGHLPRERKVALGSLALLVVLFGALILYQRFALPPSAAEPLPPPASVKAPTVPPEIREDATEVSSPVNAVVQPPQPLTQPLAGKRQVLERYGFGFSELFGDFRLHAGVDYAAAVGESVLAAGPGKVVRIDDDPAEGRVLELDHGNGLVTRYVGLGEMKVGLNASVQAGTVIGQVGAAEKTHLHFEVLLNGSPVDPAPYLKL